MCSLEQNEKKTLYPGTLAGGGRGGGGWILLWGGELGEFGLDGVLNLNYYQLFLSVSGSQEYSYCPLPADSSLHVR